MSRRVLAAWAVVMPVVMPVATTSASPLPPFELQAPDGCPTATALRERVERRLGGALDGTIHGVEISIVRRRRGFEATVDARAITMANDVRTLRSRRCEPLFDAIALIVARWAAEAAEARPVPPVVAAPPSASVEPVASERPTRGSRRQGRDPGRWGGGVHLFGISGVGALPQVNLGGELGGYLRRDDRFVQLAVGRWVPQDVEVRLDTLSVRAGWGPRRLPLRAWFTGEVGQIQGVVMADAVGAAATFRWTALGGGFGVAWPMSPTARLVGTVEVAIPLERRRVMLRGGTQLYPPAAVAARCAFGLELGWK